MILFLLGLAAAQPEPVRGHVDWQGHPTMHQTWPLLFSKGLQERTPRLSWRHQFQQTVHAPYLEASGVRIFLAAAMCAEKARDPIQARAMILEQFEFVEQFVEQHSDGFAMASTPAQARKILAETDKIVVVHSIEGGHHLLSDPEDAQFWAQRGVALITLMHLRDDELGGAALNPKWYGGRINPVGAKRQRTGERRGLTPRGREAIIELDAAGILVDFSHMAPDTVVDALGLTRDHGIPPVFTHGKLSRITDTEQGISDDQLIEVYRQGGHFALGLSALHLGAVGSEPPPDVCPETLEMFAYHHQVAHKLVLDHALELVGSDSPDDAGLTALSMGWSSDWNGWTNHSKPAYGGCRPREDARFEIDTRGLAHPGLLPEHWERIALDGGDLDPMLRSAERFLQLWQSVMPTQPEQIEPPGGLDPAPVVPEPEPQEPVVSPEPPAEPVISPVPVVRPQLTPEPAAVVDPVPEPAPVSAAPVSPAPDSPTPDSPDGVRRFNGAADALFSDFVSAGAVDYPGFAAARDRWDPVFAAVEGLELDGQSRDARRAFWINYYNLRAIRQVAEAGGIASPLDVPGFFDAKKMRVAGLSLTLNEVENRFLRPDPRVHFALVCAARGCPKIRRRGYTAAGVQAELEAATRRAINDDAWLRVKGDTVEVSKIFEWYAEDFGGPGKVGEFIDRYRRQALPEGATRVYYEYDWSLNGG